MIGVDTNILVALALESHARHIETIQCTQAQQDQQQRFVLTPLVIFEFLHLVTDTKRLSPALDITDASQWVQNWAKAMKAHFIYENEASTNLCFQWLSEFNLDRKRIHDTQLAAILHCHDVNRLLTHNVKDFRVFDVFDLVEP